MSAIYPLTKPRHIAFIEAVRREDDVTIVTRSTVSPGMGFSRGLERVELRFVDGSKRRVVAFGHDNGDIVLRDDGDDIGPGTEIWEIWEN
jgi:hypothetical protein